MASIARDAVLTYAYFAGNGGSAENSSSFIVPRAAGAITIFMPALDGSTITAKIQALSPLDNSTWSDVYSYDPGDGTMTLVGALPEAQTTVIPASAIGSGVFRFVASGSQTTAVSVPILIDRII